MYRLQSRRADENLEQRARPRHAVDLAAVELDRDGGSPHPTFPGKRGRVGWRQLIKIGTDGRLHGVDEMTDDAVFVEAVDLRQQCLDFARDGGLAFIALLWRNRQIGIKTHPEQRHDPLGDRRMLDVGRPHVVLRIRNT